MEGALPFVLLSRIGIVTLLLNGVVAFSLNIAGVFLIDSAGSLVLTLSGVFKVSSFPIRLSDKGDTNCGSGRIVDHLFGTVAWIVHHEDSDSWVRDRVAGFDHIPPHWRVYGVVEWAEALGLHSESGKGECEPYHFELYTRMHRNDPLLPGLRIKHHTTSMESFERRVSDRCHFLRSPARRA